MRDAAPPADPFTTAAVAPHPAPANTVRGDEPHAAPAAPLAVGIADVEAAARRLAGRAKTTPLVASPILDALTGARVFLKAEGLQETGSFKFRGAFNRLAMVPERERAHGVVACSSGNHAQGIAEAARLFGIAAYIVMPADAPAIKRARTERAGANVIGYQRGVENREDIAHRIAAETGATFVHPFDDPGVMAGQGTVGLEVANALAAQGLAADRVLVPTSGGGLLAGVAVALHARMPGAVCHSVEPEGFDDLARSLAAGSRAENARATGSLADALMTKTPGAHTFPVHCALCGPGLVVPEAALLAAVAFAFRELKLVVEPGGAIGLAALLAEPGRFAGETVVVVLSGANVDDAVMTRALTV